MSRIGKMPIPVPSGVDVTIDGCHVTVKGPKGTLEHDAPETITISREGDELHRDAPRRRAREPCAPRAHPFAGREHGHRRVGRFRARARDRRRRLPRRGERPATARDPGGVLASGARRRSRRNRVRGARARPASRCAASTSSSSARSPPTSARSASPSPTRARASATPTSACCARPASRRSSARTRTGTTMHNRQVARQRRHRRVRKKVRGTPERPRLAVFRSNKHVYAQVIDDVNGARSRRRRRRRRASPARRRRSRLRSRSGSSWVSAPRLRVSRRSCSTAAASSTTAGSPASPTPSAKPDSRSRTRSGYPGRRGT